MNTTNTQQITHAEPAAPIVGPRMKLSEAIRKGAAITKPLRGELYSRTKEMDEHIEYSCAMGAAFMAVVPDKIRRTRGDIDTNELAWDWFRVRLGMRVPFPELTVAERNETVGISALQYLDDLAAHSEGVCLDTAIVALNDRARWSRERIADWLESMGL